MMAARGKARVTPLAIKDAERYLKPGKPHAAVWVGESFDPAGFRDDKNKPDAKAAADFARQKIEKML